MPNLRVALQDLVRRAKDVDSAFLQIFRDRLQPAVDNILKGPSDPKQQSKPSIISADQMRGLQALQQIQLPRGASLLPQTTSSRLPERYKAWSNYQLVHRFYSSFNFSNLLHLVDGGRNFSCESMHGTG